MTEGASRTSAYYSSPVASFLVDAPPTILGILTAAHAHDLEIAQRGAWQEEIGILKTALDEIPGTTPNSRGGSNSIFNFVLSCGTHNGDKKRETEWKAFLKDTVNNRTVRARREAVIRKWFASASPRSTSRDPRINVAIGGALKAFDRAVVTLRRIREMPPKRQRRERIASERPDRNR